MFYCMTRQHKQKTTLFTRWKQEFQWFFCILSKSVGWKFSTRWKFAKKHQKTQQKEYNWMFYCMTRHHKHKTTHFTRWKQEFQRFFSIFIKVSGLKMETRWIFSVKNYFCEKSSKNATKRIQMDVLLDVKTA